MSSMDERSKILRIAAIVIARSGSADCAWWIEMITGAIVVDVLWRDIDFVSENMERLIDDVDLRTKLW